MLKSHLSVVETSASLYPHSPVFKTPRLNSTGQVQNWESVTYRQFQADIECYAKHWACVLKNEIPDRSVVGLWYTQFYFHLLYLIY